MGFIFGLVLLILGVALIIITEKQFQDRIVYGFKISVEVTVHPYQEIGLLFALIGIFLIGGNIYLNSMKRKKLD